MLVLDDILYIGKGCHQSVYVHPEDDNLCIKILTDTDPTIIKEEQRNRQRESNYLERVEHRTPQCKCLVRFIGIVETNFGEGAVYTLVRDADGQISSSLEDYLQNFPKVEDDYISFMEAIHDLQLALESFKGSMLENRIITRNIRPVNICVQKNADNSIENLVLIDDIGSTELIPIVEYVSVLATYRVKRKWKKFVNLLRGYVDNYEFQEMLDEIDEK